MSRRFSPAEALRLTTLAIGGNFICGLELTQAVLCWGENEQGQLGNGSTANKSVPTAISGLSSGIIALAGGYNHTLILKADGTVYSCGANADGQLGLGHVHQPYRQDFCVREAAGVRLGAILRQRIPKAAGDSGDNR